jgi:putative PIG3 family NAD(P)H quinone oxidoreductase
MRAVTIPRFGDADVLTVADIPQPELTETSVLIDVAAAGVNRADIGQRQGSYPPPAGAPDWPGMELSGVITAIGEAVAASGEFHIGDRVCALVPGGAYADRAVVDARLLIPVPDSIGLVDAAGIPEAACTVWSNVFMAAGLQSEQTLLVHGGSSGVGSLAVQLASALGCRVFATAGSPDKVRFCEDLGATGIDYRREDFAERLKRDAPAGADVILDLVGGAYLTRNIDALSIAGTIMIIANQSGEPGAFDIGALIRKRGRIWATTLRARTIDERAQIVRGVRDSVMPLFASGRIHTVTDSTFTLDEAGAAHRRMESSQHLGKILLIAQGESI